MNSNSIKENTISSIYPLGIVCSPDAIKTKIDEEHLQRVQTCEYLRILFDSYFKWVAHISTLTKKN